MHSKRKGPAMVSALAHYTTCKPPCGADFVTDRAWLLFFRTLPSEERALLLETGTCPTEGQDEITWSCTITKRLSLCHAEICFFPRACAPVNRGDGASSSEWDLPYWRSARMRLNAHAIKLNKNLSLCPAEIWVFPRVCATVNRGEGASS